jgi:uncharacterized membrane protein YhdT
MGNKDGWRRIGAGVCLVGAPLIILVGVILHAGLREGPFEDALETVRGASDRWWTGSALQLVGLTLLIGAVLAVVHLCRVGGSDGYGLAGGAVTIIGLASVIAIQALEMLLFLMVQSGQDAGAMRNLAVAVDESNRFALLFVASLGFFIGWLILAYGLYRAEGVPTWVPATQAVGIVLFIGIIPGADPLVIIGVGLQLIALGFLGVQAFQHAGAWSAAERQPASA